MSGRWFRATHLILASGAACLLIFIATIPLPRADDHLIGSDGFFYYAILRSAVLDADLHFGNDYELLGLPKQPQTPMGLPANQFAVGASLLWLPFFLLAHGLSLALSSMGVPAAADGASYVYQSFVCAGTILYASAGFFLAYRAAGRYCRPRPAAGATLALWWATPAIYYIIAEPSMSHGLSVFTMGLFLYLWRPMAERGLLAWAALGGAAGLAALVRWQEGLVALIPLGELVWRVARRETAPARAGACLCVYAAAILLVFSPQMAFWNALYGSPLTMPQGERFMNWFSPAPLKTLFSTRHGLVAWHPVFAAALAGLFALRRRSRPLAAAVLFLFLAQLYVNSAVERWWADDAFGGRRFTGLAPWFVLAAACLIEDVRGRWARPLIVLFLGACVAWNGLSFAQYRLGVVSRSEALTLREMTIDRILLAPRLLDTAVKAAQGKPWEPFADPAHDQALEP